MTYLIALAAVIVIGLLALGVAGWWLQLDDLLDDTLTPRMSGCPWTQYSDSAVCDRCGQVTDMHHQDETRCPRG